MEHLAYMVGAYLAFVFLLGVVLGKLIKRHYREPDRD